MCLCHTGLPQLNATKLRLILLISGQFWLTFHHQYRNQGIPVFKRFISGGISSDIRSEIEFYVKRDFRMYIRRYASPNTIFEYGYPHSYALLQFHLKLDSCKPHKAARHPTKCDVINDAEQFLTVYRKIYCRNFLTLSNQTSSYKSMCIRIHGDCAVNYYKIQTPLDRKQSLYM